MNRRRTEPTRFQAAAVRVALFFLVFTLALIGLEMVLRTTHALGARISWAEPDDVLGFRYTPGAHYWYLRENTRPIEGRINSFGWRDIEWTVEKPDGVIRVAVLGDSYVEAFQVESERTFLKLAEKHLNSGHAPRFEIMNFGRAGFTQSEEMIVLRDKVLSFSPDMVILFFYPPNDIADMSPETSPGGARPYLRIGANGSLEVDASFADSPRYRLKSRFNWVKKRSALLSMVAERWIEFSLRRTYREEAQLPPPSEWSSNLRGYLSLCTDRPDSAFVRSYELCKQVIRLMSELCRAGGIRFMLVCIDDVYVPAVEDYCRRRDPSFDADFFERDLRRLAESIDAEFLGLQSIFKSHFQRTGVALHFGEFDPETMNMNGGHWNYDGHEVVARALAQELASLPYDDQPVGAAEAVQANPLEDTYPEPEGRSAQRSP